MSLVRRTRVRGPRLPAARSPFRRLTRVSRDAPAAAPNSEAIAQTEVCQKWWQHMGDIMPSNDDHSPVAENLKEVFHIEK